MMKKLITTLLILFSLASQAQTYKYLTIPGETGRVRGAIVIDGITMLSSIDTLPVPITMRSMHGLIGKGDSLYRYSPVQHKWIPISGGGASVWGSITGLLSNQTDIQTALNNKQNKLLQGTPAQYFRGDLSLGTFATDVLSTVGTRLLPTGGAAGSILVKNSGNNYDVSWQANPDRYIASGSVVGAKYKSIYGTYNDGTSVLIGTFQDLMDTSETIAVDTMYKSGVNLTYRIAGRTYTLPNVFNDSLGIYFSEKFKVSGAGNVAGDRDSVDLADDVWDKINEVATPGNYPTYPDFTDSLQAHWSAIMQRYTAAQSDARFYPLDLNPKGYLTAVPATDDPYRIDSTTITGEDNPRTLTNYYHNGATSSTSYNDFKSDYWRKNGAGDLYHLETNGTGFVGIGTNAPAASIHVAANYSIGSVAGFLLEDKTTPGAFLKVMDGTAATNSMVPMVWGRGVTGQLPHAINNNNRDGLELIGDIGYDTTFNAGVTIIGRNHTGGVLTQAPALRITNHLSTIATFNADSTVTFNYLKAGRTIPTQPGTPRSVVVYDNGTFGVGTGTGSGGAYTFTNSSIVNTGDNLTLSGDAASPGASKVYGTNSSGTKGYQSTTIIDPTGFVVGDWLKKTATGFMRIPHLTLVVSGTSGPASYDSVNNIVYVPNYGAGVALTTTDNYMNVAGTVLTTKKGWNSITWASSIIVNAATSSNHTVTLGGTTAISISNPQDGQILLLELVQDATGSRTVTWPSDVDWSWAATKTQPSLRTSPGDPNVITLTYKLATSKWYGTY